MKMRYVALMLGFGFVLAAARPAAAESSCTSIVKSVFAANSYEATISIHGKSDVQATTYIQKPDRIHVIEPKIEMIGIGSKSWMRLNGGAWQSTPVALGGLASMDPSQFMKTKGTLTCTDAGMGMWHGQPAHIYKTTSSGSKAGPGHATMYVGTDGFVRHVEFQTAKVSGSEDLSKFNAVKITPP